MATSYLAPAPVVRRVRGYFAAVNRAAGVPVIFDPAEMVGFSLDTPPAPWVPLGWIADFARKSESRSAAVMTGVPAAVLEQARETVEAQVGFRFLSWTKLTMALGVGSQHMNVLAAAPGSAAAGDGGTAVAAVPVEVAGSTATFIGLAAADAATFAAGQMVAVDVDYTGQVGFVGSPVSGAYVKSALTNVDYVRRVTFNVARVASVISSGANAGLTLAAALPGGVPATGMKAQVVTGFVDRDGGSFYQEWSGLFVMEGAQGEMIFLYYPRLQAVAGAEEIATPIDAKRGGTLERMLLSGSYRALPVTDPLDGERVVCYRSFMPGAGALV